MRLATDLAVYAKCDISQYFDYNAGSIEVA